MAEAFRVINKRFIILVLILFALNGINFIKDQYVDVTVFSSEAGGEDALSRSEVLKFRNEIYDEFLEEIEKTGECPQIQSYEYGEDTEIVLSQEEEIRNSIIYELNQQKEHFEKYATKYDEIKKYADNSSNISIFNTEGNFSKRNIEKTVNDFEAVKDVKPEYGNNQWILKFTVYSITDYCILIIIVYIIFQFGIEQKSSFLYFVHSTKGGRGELTVKRVALIFSITAVLSAVFYGSILICSNVMYGAGMDFARPIQSIQAYESCPIKLSIGEFLILYYVVKYLTLIFFAMFVWAIFSKLSANRSKVLVLGIVLALEYLAYSITESHSAINHIKYINIFNYLNTGDFIGKYQNLNVFSFPVNVLKSSVLILCFGIVVLTGVIVYKGIIIYNDSKKSMISARRMADSIQRKMSPVLDSIGLIMGEGIKIFTIIGGIYIVLIFSYVAGERVDSDKLLRSNSGKIKAWYYSELYGPYSEEMQDEINQILTDIDKEYKEIQESYALGEMDGIIYRSKLEVIDNKKLVLEEISRHVEYLKILKEERQIAGYLADPIGVTYLFGEPLRNDFLIDGIIISAFIAIFTGGVFAYEYKSNMIKFVNSTKKGRKELKLSKALWCMSASGIFAVAISLIEYNNVQGKVGIMGMDAPVQSFQMFENIPFEMNVRTFVVCMYAIRVIFSIVLTLVAIAISKYTRNIAEGQILSISVVVIPGILYYFGIQVFSYVSLGRTLSVSDVITEANVWSGEIIKILPVMAVIGILSGWIYIRDKKSTRN